MYCLNISYYPAFAERYYLRPFITWVNITNLQINGPDIKIYLFFFLIYAEDEWEDSCNTGIGEDWNGGFFIHLCTFTFPTLEILLPHCWYLQQAWENHRVVTLSFFGFIFALTFAKHTGTSPQDIWGPNASYWMLTMRQSLSSQGLSWPQLQM